MLSVFTNKMDISGLLQEIAAALAPGGLQLNLLKSTIITHWRTILSNMPEGSIKRTHVAQKLLGVYITERGINVAVFIKSKKL
jgi:hypothetical protein